MASLSNGILNGRQHSMGKHTYIYHPITDGVLWIEKYAHRIENIFKKVPKLVTSILATLAIFVFGTSLQGEWMLILVHFFKQMGHTNQNNTDCSENMSEHIFVGQQYLEPKFVFNHWRYFVGWAVFGSYSIHFTAGGLLHWYFYVRQRDKPHTWKSQPEKFLSPNLERHEIMTSCLSMFFTSTLAGLFSCYIYNEGSLQWVYYSPSEYGWWWFFLQAPVIFIYQDYAIYLTHRLYHTPFLYRNFHKLHHKYKQPTAFSVTAIHPVEIVHLELIMYVPLFVMPVHWLMFHGVVLYTYYHGILQHSGITFKAQWWQPWQPDAIFHDYHHQYTHFNFGVNIYFWDVLHDTYRRKDSVHTEDKSLLNDIYERELENPQADPDNAKSKTK